MNNDFLQKLLSFKKSTPSPLDSPEAEEGRLRLTDPEAFAPAEEGGDLALDEAPVQRAGQLASDADIAAIQNIPMPEAQKSVRTPAATPAPMQAPEVSSQELSVEDPQQQQMSRYKQLLEEYNTKNRDLNLLQGGNQIAQAFAMGSGAKISDGSESVKMLRDQNVDPLKQIQSEDTATMADPGSDVSKMYREQAYALLKKLSPDKNYDGQLENMSASQLMKLPGMKSAFGSSGSPSPWIATDRVDSNGNPVRFNKSTGEYSLTDGTVLMPGDKTVRDVARRDALTGNYGYVNAGTGMNVVPTNRGALASPGQTDSVGQPKAVTYEDFARNAPDERKEFNKIRDQFNNDMKESREVATSVTNLASKLKPGPNGEIDSGLLGGIQTQAAKMAGQKGVLTDQDLVKFAGAGGVPAKLSRIANGSIFGEMSEDDVKFFKRFAQLMGKSLNEDIINRSQLYTNQGKQIIGTTMPGVTEQDVAKMLGVDKVAPVVQGSEKITSNNKQEPKGGEVKRKTADGKIAIFDEATEKFLRYEE